MMPEPADGAPADAAQTPRNLAPAVRASLNAKLVRLLDRPLIGQIASPTPEAERDGASDDLPGAFRALQNAARALTPATTAAGRTGPWREDPDDGTCHVRITLDYEDMWRGGEKEILETVSGAVENAISFLTEEQKVLLERSPREFLALAPRPESAELVSFETANIGGTVRVVGLRLAAAPESRASIRHIAIIPNLVQIERQLDALQTIERGFRVRLHARMLVRAANPGRSVTAEPGTSFHLAGEISSDGLMHAGATERWPIRAQPGKSNPKSTLRAQRTTVPLRHCVRFSASVTPPPSARRTPAWTSAPKVRPTTSVSTSIRPSASAKR